MAFLGNGGSLLIYARASFITSDIDRLTEHWDAESVPRAVLIQPGLIFQRY